MNANTLLLHGYNHLLLSRQYFVAVNNKICKEKVPELPSC